MATSSALSSASALAFTFSTQQLRAVLIDGEPWLVAADVCAALDVQNVTQAVARLDDDERAMFNIGRQGDASVINESGLYSLVLTSRKPEAQRFKKWVTSEVLPAIRKTGRYEAQPAAPAVELLTRNDMANLSRLVSLIAHWFRDKQLWVQAVWFALRQATGTRAPQYFTVEHLPALSAELRRCWLVAEQLRAAQMIETAEKDRAFNSLLAAWNERELLKLTAREVSAWHPA